MTDEEYLAWMAAQDAQALPPAIIVSELKHHAPLFFNKEAMRTWMCNNEIRDESRIIGQTDLIPLIRGWVDGIIERPVVLSVRDFNCIAHGEFGWIYLMEDMLDAYEVVMVERFPHRFDSPRHIHSPEWIAFFEQYGGEGVVAGTIARDGSNVESRPATYYFSDPKEAAFARMAF